MKSSMILFALFCIGFIGSGQTPENSAFRKYTREIQIAQSNDYEDLDFLKRKIKDKRILLLGESSHTIGDFYLLKTRLVKFLHEECGYDVFAMESGIADVYTIYNQLDTLSGEQLMKKTLYANLSCNEMKPLFDYIKNSPGNRLQYCGFDSQNHGSSLELIGALLHEKFGIQSDSLVSNLNKYYQIPQIAWLPDKGPITALADTIMSSAAQLIELFQGQKTYLLDKQLLTETHYKILERSLYNHRDAVNLNWVTDNPLEKRDSLMAENLIYLITEIFPNKKIIVWAHNTHIDKGGTDAVPRSMGYYLEKKLTNQTYHIGLYARTGELYWWWTKDTRSFDNSQPNDIEYLADQFPITFLDLSGKSKRSREIHQTLMGYEAEFGRKVAFIPADRYDAIITFRKVTATTYGSSSP